MIVVNRVVLSHGGVLQDGGCNCDIFLVSFPDHKTLHATNEIH